MRTRIEVGDSKLTWEVSRDVVGLDGYRWRLWDRDGQLAHGFRETEAAAREECRLTLLKLFAARAQAWLRVEVQFREEVPS